MLSTLTEERFSVRSGWLEINTLDMCVMAKNALA